MRSTTMDDEAALLDFVGEAKAALEADKNLTSYGQLECGEWFALRWGITDRSIAVLRIDAYFSPVNYCDALQRI